MTPKEKLLLEFWV